MVKVGIMQIRFRYIKGDFMRRKFRRIIKAKNSKLQGYQVSWLALLTYLFVSVLVYATGYFISRHLLIVIPVKMIYYWIFGEVLVFVLIVCTLIIGYKRRDRISTIDIPPMSNEAKKLSKKILRLFSDKQIIDVLRLSNSTRYGEEMPCIIVYVADDLSSGFVAIENIANFERMDKNKYEQKVSGIFAGKFKKYAVVSSDLTKGDVYMKFNFEDTLTSQRFIVSGVDDLGNFVSNNPHHLKLSRDLVWFSDKTPHLSIIARTRAGKSYFAGRYLAKLMILQGWEVEYNSAKHDLYVEEFSGESDVEEIVKRAEYWVTFMDDRLKEINELGFDKYLESDEMYDIGLFFDELGNLNAELESQRKLKGRWETAINKLSATGASAGIHIIAISQFGTKEGFLPSVARVNCSDGAIMLGGAADEASERRYIMGGYPDLPKRNYKVGQGLARIITSGERWEKPHFFETPYFRDEE